MNDKSKIYPEEYIVTDKKPSVILDYFSEEMTIETPLYDKISTRNSVETAIDKRKNKKDKWGSWYCGKCSIEVDENCRCKYCGKTEMEKS